MTSFVIIGKKCRRDKGGAQLLALHILTVVEVCKWRKEGESDAFGAFQRLGIRKAWCELRGIYIYTGCTSGKYG